MPFIRLLSAGTVIYNVRAVVGDNFLHGGDSALYHLVVGFFCCDALSPQTRCSEYAGELVVVSAAELDELIAKPHHDRQKQQTEHGSQECYAERLGGYEHTYEYAHEQGHYEEGGTAAGMKAYLLAYVLYGKLLVVFITEYGLVLGSVILEYALHILHARYKEQIAQEQQYLQHALER